jgi:hypothetical protein
MTDHPISPPPELVQEWFEEASRDGTGWPSKVAIAAAQWGADQELLACGNYLKQCAAWEEEDVIEFYNYRRPRPPSLKEQALMALKCLESESPFEEPRFETIRRALEQLDD